MALFDFLEKPLTFLSENGLWKSVDNRLYQATRETRETVEDVFESASRNPVVRTIAETIPKISDFITPDSEEEALQMGSVPLKNIRTGETLGYLDPLGAVGSLRTTGIKLGRKALESIARETNELVIKNILKQGSKNIGDDVAESLSRRLKNVNSVERADELIRKATSPIERTRGFVESVQKEFPNIKRVSGQYITRSTDELAVKARNLIKKGIDLAENLARTGTDEKATATAAELIKHYNQQALKSKSEAVANALYDRAAIVANDMAEKLTNQGKSIQAASILSRLTPEGQVKFAAREIQKYNEGVSLAKRIPELTGEQTKYIVKEMQAVQSMIDGEAKAIRFHNLQNFISDLVPSSLYQKLVSVWKAGLLTGIKTSGLNIFSNISHGVLEVAKDVPAVAVDSVASLFTKKRTVAFTARGSLSGINEGFKKGVRYLTTGFDERNIGVKLDYKRVNFGKNKIARGLQRYEESIFRLMGTEDQPFYYGAKARSVAGQATVKAKNAGLKGKEAQRFVNNLIENPTDDMVRYAVLDAETAVYQNPTTLGKIAKQIQGAPGGEFIVPFGRTPSAVAMQIINYSPIGIGKTIAQNIGKGKFDQRLLAQGLGRGITGTGFLWLGGEMYKKGMVALDYPKTEKERELWKAEGRKPNSIKIGDKWRSPFILGPAGNLLLVGGHFSYNFEQEGSPTGAMIKSLAGSVKSFTEQTFVRGIDSFVKALTDPERSAEYAFSSFVSSFVPTLSSDLSKVIDPLERRAEDVVERILSRVPVARQNFLEPQIDILGRERERMGNVLETLLDPTRPSKDISTDTTKELRRLFDAGHKVSPTLLGDKKGYEGLSQKENTELWKLTGTIIDEKLTSLFSREAYQKLPDDKKADVVEDVISKSKLIARVGMVIELTENLEGSQLKGVLAELKEGGILNREVFNTYLQIR